jgi:hypothetical protein
MLPPPITRPTWTTETEDFRDFACDSPDDDGVDAVLMIAEQRLATQFSTVFDDKPASFAP